MGTLRPVQMRGQDILLRSTTRRPESIGKATRSRRFGFRHSTAAVAIEVLGLVSRAERVGRTGNMVSRLGKSMRNIHTSGHARPILLIVRELGVDEMKLCQPQPAPLFPPSQPKPRRFSKNALIGIAIIIVALVVAGGYGGTRVYQASFQPNIQATAVSIGAPSTNPSSSTPVDNGRVTSPGSFDYTTNLPGTYALVWDNSFSVFTSKSISVTYTVSGSTHSQSFTVQPGHYSELSFDLGTGDRIYGNFAISGGSNDVNFYITAQTCTETVGFTFTLVNPGNANGFATARLLEDGKDTSWSNRYYVPQGGQAQGSGTITLPDCASHILSVSISTQEKA
jgi:hypothetical protein